MKEGTISSLIMLGLSRVTKSKVFRNNTGMGWQGISKPTNNGDRLIIDPRPLHSGLCKGSSDLIGWTPIIITKEMVGKTIGVFTAVEVKKENGRASKEQLNFIQRVKDDGGIAGIATNPDEAINLVQNMLKRNDLMATPNLFVDLVAASCDLAASLLALFCLLISSVVLAYS